MKRFIVTAAILLVPNVTFAETQIERFESLAADVNSVMVGMMANEVEEQGGDGSALRNIDSMFGPWTPEIRAAAQCVLDSYEEEIGSDGIDAMLDSMEQTLPKMADLSMTAAEEMGLMDDMTPEGISEERTIEISQSCNMIALQMEAGSQTGFMEAMMEAGSTIPQNN